MKLVDQKLLGISFKMPVPENEQEFTASLPAGSTETVLSFACAEAYYRGIAPKYRNGFLEEVEKATGIKPAVVGKKTVGEKEVEILEKDTTYIKRVLAEGITAGDLAPILQKVVDEIGWDLSSTRGSRVSAQDKRDAEFFIGAIANGKSTWDRVVGNLEARNPGLQIVREADGSVSLENLATACRVERDRLAEVAAKERASAL